MNTHVFAVFKIDGNYFGFNLLEISSTLEKAREFISCHINTLGFDDNEINPAHKDMNETNNYTHFGNRKDCIEPLIAGWFGGYVIEEMTVDNELEIEKELKTRKQSRRPIKLMYIGQFLDVESWRGDEPLGLNFIDDNRLLTYKVDVSRRRVFFGTLYDADDEERLKKKYPLFSIHELNISEFDYEIDA